MSETLYKSVEIRAAKSESRSVEVIASTDTIDSYGEVIEQSSWKLDRYTKNPVVLYAHQARELPIGTASDVRIEEGKLCARITFVAEEVNPRAEQVWKSIQAGTLRAVSVGFRAHTYRWEMRDDKEILVLADCELMEISVVAIPANPDALARIRSKALAAKNADGDWTPASDVEAMLKMAGAKSAAEAEGLLRAWQESHSRVKALEDAEAKRLAEALERERTELLHRAFATGRLPKAAKEDSSHWVHSLPIEGLRKFAAEAQQRIPVGNTHAEPPSDIPAEVKSLTQKKWANLTADEKHLLHTKFPQLAESLRKR